MKFKTLLLDSFFPHFRKEIHKYINICTNEPGTNVIVGHDNSLYTMIQINGSKSIHGELSLDDYTKNIVSATKGNLRNSGRKLQFIFHKDPEGAKRVLDPYFAPLLKSAKGHKLELEDILKSQYKLLEGKIHYEACFLCFQTSIDAIPGQAKLLRKQSLPTNAVMKNGVYGQSPFLFIDKLFQLHKAFVQQVSMALSRFMLLEPMSVEDALYEIRYQIHPGSLPAKWNPVLAGSKIKPKFYEENRDFDYSQVLPIDLTDQLFNFQPYKVNNEPSIIKYNDTYIAPFLIDNGPCEEKAFTQLFNNINNTIPWRVSFTIYIGHKNVLSFISTKKIIAMLLTWTNSSNRAILDAAKEFLDDNRQQKVFSKAHISFCTWAKSLQEVYERKNALMQAATSWGDMTPLEERGNIYTAWIESLPMLAKSPVSTGYPEILENIFKILPITRPANAFKHGQLPLISHCGKFMPVDLFSELQAFWVEIVFAKPGSGKSVLLALKNLFLALAFPESPLLPYIVTLDIGTSSIRVNDFIRDFLPEEKKLQIGSWRLKNRADNAINPFDTPLGFRYPPSYSTSRLYELASVVFTSGESIAYNESDKMYIPDFVGIFCHCMYEYKDIYEPEMYNQYVDDYVDNTLHKHQVMPEKDMTWYQIVDLLVELKEYDAAIKAQRYAVPNFSHASQVIAQHEKMRTLTRRSPGLEGHLQNMLLSIVNDYPVLTGPTRFDIGNARIIALDLEEVIPKSSSPRDIKQKNIFYLLARYATTKKFYLTDDFIEEVPDKYREYHLNVYNQEKGLPKSFNVDEYSRTEKCEPFKRDCISDSLTGRKLNIMLTIVSQNPSHFDEDLITNSSNKYILTNSDDDIESFNYICSKFNLSEDEALELQHKVLPPDKNGSNMMLISSTNKGRVANVLKLPVCAELLWGLNNTKSDVFLYNEVKSIVGGRQAINILSKHFPSGSAKGFMAAQMRSGGNQGNSHQRSSKDEVPENYIQSLAKTLLEKENILTMGMQSSTTRP